MRQNGILYIADVYAHIIMYVEFKMNHHECCPAEMAKLFPIFQVSAFGENSACSHPRSSLLSQVVGTGLCASVSLWVCSHAHACVAHPLSS